MASQTDSTTAGASRSGQVAAAVTAAYIARQRLLTLTLTRDLIVLVRELFSPDRPGLSWMVTRTQAGSLIRERHRLAADLAARYYVDLRRASLQPAQVRRVRPEATREPDVAERPPARDVVETVNREAGQHRVRVEPTARLRDDLGLDVISEREAWAELERLAGVGPNDLDEDRVEANLDATGIASYQKALRAGQTPEQAVDTMAVNMAGSATTLVLEGGREVVHRAVADDEDALGWVRVTDADPCSWCAMHASRAASTLYRSEGTAGRNKNAKFIGDGQFKWHDHCGCTAVAVFSRDDPHLQRAEELYDQWARATQGYTGKRAVNAWRRYWENRDQEHESEGEG